MRSASSGMGAVELGAEDGATVTAGVCLGADYCSEHEWGLSRLEQYLGVGRSPTPLSWLSDNGFSRDDLARAGWKPEDALGFDGRTMSAQSGALGFWWEKGGDALFCAGDEARGLLRAALEEGARVRRPGGDWLEDEAAQAAPREGGLFEISAPPKSLASLIGFPSCSDLPSLKKPGRTEWRRPRNKAEREAHMESTAGFRACWDEGCFAVMARGDQAVSTLRLVRSAFERGRMTAGMNGKGANPFARSGLVLLDRDLIPARHLRAAVSKDLDHRALLLAAQRAGVREALERAGKRFHAVSPRWREFTEDSGLAGLEGVATESERMMFWLNPWEQGAKYGWYNAHELLAWAEGRDTPVTAKGDLSPLDVDVNVRMRAHMDPEAFDEAVDALRRSGFDPDGPEARRDYARISPMLDGAGGAFACVHARSAERSGRNGPERPEARSGWFTAAELARRAAGLPGPADGPGEARPRAEMMEALEAERAPAPG